jgi:ParB-like chromosome segregation protein Spo0J
MRKNSFRPVNIDIKIERWPIERLIPRANNPRTHSNAQIDQIAGSVVEFGFTNPILIEPDGLILAGYARLAAAKNKQSR